MLGFILGLFAGGLIGVFILAICIAAASED